MVYRKSVVDHLYARRRGPACPASLAWFWVRCDEGAWSILKGRFADPEPRGAAAASCGGTGTFPGAAPIAPPSRAARRLSFAAERDFDPSQLRSNLFEMEWPPRSGKKQAFPEVDRAAWFTLDCARRKIVPGQQPLLDALNERIGNAGTASGRASGSLA
jgi:predicted NUDIX family NTP pyrophosphohydrolase